MNQCINQGRHCKDLVFDRWYEEEGMQAGREDAASKVVVSGRRSLCARNALLHVYAPRTAAHLDRHSARAIEWADTRSYQLLSVSVCSHCTLAQTPSQLILQTIHPQHAQAATHTARRDGGRRRPLAPAARWRAHLLRLQPRRPAGGWNNGGGCRHRPQQQQQ